MLRAVIEQYIDTAEPVSSGSLTRERIAASPATVRNVMSELERGGLLSQPHTSAGRIPTEQGFRVYIDSLLHPHPVSRRDRESIRRRLDADEPGMDVALERLSQVLSMLSGQAAIVASPRLETLTLRRVEFVDVGQLRLLSIFITDSGLVFQRMVQLGEALSGADLEFFHNYLNALVEGRTLSQLRARINEELSSERAEYDRLRGLALRTGAEALCGVNAPDEVFVEGQSNLLEHPEFLDASRLKSMLLALEHKERLLRLIDELATEDGVRVVLGTEADGLSMDGLGIIASSYSGGSGETRGQVALIGPTRMNYPKLIPLLAYAVGQLSVRLSDRER